MVGETSIIQEKNHEPAAELYRLIGEGYKAMQEKREITLEELEEARACYQRGEYKDFDDALDEIDKKYGL